MKQLLYIPSGKYVLFFNETNMDKYPEWSIEEFFEFRRLDETGKKKYSSYKEIVKQFISGNWRKQTNFVI